MSKENLIKKIPNLFTLANLTSGVIALLVAVFYQTQEAITISCILIFCGVVFDFFDGFFARKLNAQSPIGKELDSFADAITFGVSPIAICLTLHYMVHDNSVLFIEILIATFYIMCAVYRLARYNTTQSSGYFEGIPTTLSGGLLALFVLVSNYTLVPNGFDQVYTIAGYVIGIALGLGMISKFRVRKLRKKPVEEVTE